MMSDNLFLFRPADGASTDRYSSLLLLSLLVFLLRALSVHLSSWITFSACNITQLWLVYTPINTVTEVVCQLVSDPFQCVYPGHLLSSLYHLPHQSIELLLQLHPTILLMHVVKVALQQHKHLCFRAAGSLIRSRRLSEPVSMTTAEQFIHLWKTVAQPPHQSINSENYFVSQRPDVSLSGKLCCHLTANSANTKPQFSSKLFGTSASTQ